ncbi:type IIL restriction-modification enzyme MmeI [Frondihabitans sucicola]|uniref:type IIL restriction-modification enzyme MmeI n=1 Tax=Frondihabitans sucicola TaxID=1268041 RepID=UPI003305C75F
MGALVRGRRPLRAGDEPPHPQAPGGGAGHAARQQGRDHAAARGHPYLFVQPQQPTEAYVCIPRHFSESRRYITVGHFGPDVIAGDANFTALDPDGLVFAAISSTMFATWQKTIGGRIKSDIRFASTLTWNTFPFPDVSDADRQRIIEAGEGVLAARRLQPGKSLADLYQPLGMARELLDAHRALDKAVDKVFGFAKPPAEPQRQARLFERYQEMTSVGQLG